MTAENLEEARLITLVYQIYMSGLTTRKTPNTPSRRKRKCRHEEPQYVCPLDDGGEADLLDFSKPAMSNQTQINHN